MEFVLYFPVMNREYLEHIISDNFSEKHALVVFAGGPTMVLGIQNLLCGPRSGSQEHGVLNSLCKSI